MRILGLDLSTTSTGWAIFNNGEYECSGVIQPAGEWHERCELIVDELNRLNFDVVVIEAVYEKRFTNAKVTIMLAVLQGMIRYMAHSKWVPVFDYYPTAWRKIIGIQMKGLKRQQAKQMAIDMVQDLYGVECNDDQAEAILIAKSYVDENI